MKAEFKTLIQNICLLISVTLMSFLILELYCRSSAIKGFHDQRALFVSGPIFQVQKNRSVKFIPNTDIREVAVYGNEIEYDIIYRTNDYGFIATEDYDAKTKDQNIENHIAIVGDSFVAGSGFGDWVSSLLIPMIGNKDTQIYNLGVMGTGTRHFKSILASSGRKIPITHIVVVMISGDLTRPHWTPITKPEGIYFYMLDRSGTPIESSANYIIGFIDPDADYSQIIKSSEQYRLRRHGIKPNIKLGKITFVSYFYKKISDMLKKSSPRMSRPSDQPKPDAGLKALERIVQKHRNIPVSLVHLPEKQEVQSGKYYYEIEDPVKQMGIQYYPALQMREWTTDDFLRYDSHPNKKGYLKIADILKQVVGSLPAPQFTDKAQ